MIFSVAILTKKGEVFVSSILPNEIVRDVKKYARNFLQLLDDQDEDFEPAFIESEGLRYIYKQTDDLYWLLVTMIESDMYADINLLGKFVCTIMEYGLSETDSRSLTEGQKDLFYIHIWRPWDTEPQCPSGNADCKSSVIWEREFESRFQFLVSVRDGHVQEDDIQYFNGLVAESWDVKTKLSPKWKATVENDSSSETDSACSGDDSNQSISEETVIECCRLKCRFEDLKTESTRILDPYLRLFARRDMLVGSCYDLQNRSIQLGSAPPANDISLHSTILQ